MYTWNKSHFDGLPIYHCSLFDWLPDILHGFTTRQGGVSRPPYDSLNLGAHVGDDPEDVEINRYKVTDCLDFKRSQVALAAQIHGDKVVEVTSGAADPVADADALITNTPDVLLMLFFADCVPVYLVDPVHRAVGLVHAGWRGTKANIVGKTVKAMTRAFGTDPKMLLAASGPCIGAESYEVREDVARHFRDVPVDRYVGTVIPVWPKNELTGTFALDLRQVIYLQLIQAGLSQRLISIAPHDTVRNRKDFFSHRRDGAATGRMAGLLAVRSRAEFA
jgi:YfiH family protein